MSFEFLGTFNRSQFERFLAFARSQVGLANERILHLQAEADRIGTITFRYSNGVPQGFSADPPASYVGQLLQAYEVLGGNPFVDLRVRLRTDPIYLIRGTEVDSPQYMSNGEVIGAKGLSDSPTAELMRQAQSWVDGTLQARFGNMERKIRRAVDYSDQLQLEIANLKTIQLAATVVGSLEYIASQINQFLVDQNYRAVFDDNGGDRFGFNVYAPFSSYDVLNGQATSAQRQNSGFVGPGGSGT